MAKQKAIIHPTFDALAIGGLSIVFLVALLLFDPGWAQDDIAQKFVILSALFNWPHFMATYNLMYRSPETVKRYPSAAIWIPLALLVTTVVAVLAATLKGFEGSLDFLTYMAGGYLAWHYTGQTWGMMASFSFIDGTPFEDHERTWIRTGLRVLLAWHLVWFLHTVSWDGVRLGTTATYHEVYKWATIVMLPLGAIIGLVGLWKWNQRIERRPPPRVIVPFFAINLWYITMSLNPLAIFWVQIAHSLQYMIFPLRVEINRGAAKNSSALRSLVIFVMAVLGLGLAVFVALPWVIELGLGSLGRQEAEILVTLGFVKLGIGAFINIHHYFADGVLWKISNPAVKKELFAHLKR